MEKIRIMVVTGTRPEIIKVSVLLRLIAQDPELELIFVHSGQHYDDKLVTVFLKQLELPSINFNLEIGSAPNLMQSVKIAEKLYEIILKEKPDIILGQGDTNTVFSSGLAAFKMNIPFGHIEAGIRSFDVNMPEEINRILVSKGSILSFAPTERACLNLINEGISPHQIFLVGNTIVDVVKQNVELANKISTIEKQLKLENSTNNILLTVHRPSNVDNKEIFSQILTTLSEFKNCRFIYPIHPRSLARLKEYGIYEKIKAEHIIELIDPLDYFDMLKLMSLSKFILTDSGGIQEEAIVLHKPCLTLRDNTERPESIEAGANILVGSDPIKIKINISKLLNDSEFYQKMIPTINPFGDGTSSAQIIALIKDHYRNNQLKIKSSIFNNEIPCYKLIQITPNEKGITVKQYELNNKCQIIELFDSNGNNLFPQKNMILEPSWHIKTLNVHFE